MFRIHRSLLLQCTANSTSAPWRNKSRKKTDQGTVHSESCIFSVVATIHSFLFSYILRKTFYAFSSFFLVSLACANSLVNPILYAFRIPEFKRAMMSLFSGCNTLVQVLPQSYSLLLWLLLPMISMSLELGIILSKSLLGP